MAIDTETDVAKAIAGGELESPQQFANVWLFDLRITGTGLSYRAKEDEYCLRLPENYLNQEFLDRCNGLPVVLEHPDKAALDSEEFKDRVIGSICWPYIKGEEVWGIARIYDDMTAAMMRERQLSTSPSVVFPKDGAGRKEEIDGKTILIEGKPMLLDHLAVVENGVWDKGGKPSGVKSLEARADSNAVTQEAAMADEQNAAPSGQEVKPDNTPAAPQGGLEQVLAAVQALTAKVEALEAAGKPAADADAAAAQPSPDAKPDNAEPSEDIAALKARMDSLEAASAKKDAEEEPDEAAMADAQCRADSVYQAFNKSAPRAMRGESLLAYRKRLLAEFKGHSKQYASVDVHAINDAALFDVVEKQIYADAAAAAVSPANIPAGQLIERKRADGAGRTISEFFGTVSAWTDDFKRKKMRLAKINV